jgi:cytochrome c5
MSATAVVPLTAAFAALALVCAASGSAQDADPGERIMNASCQTSCHTVRVIQTQAMNDDAWTKSVGTMVDKGAKISKDDIPTLVRYLAEHYGPIPDGPGKEIVLNTCTMCHDLGRIKQGRRSPEEWEETLISMLNEGAPLSDDNFALVHRYLSKNFGVE